MRFKVVQVYNISFIEQFLNQERRNIRRLAVC